MTSPSVTPVAKKEKKDKDEEKKEISDLKKEVSDLRRSQAEETEKKYADLLATRARTVSEVKGTLMAGAPGGGTTPLMPTTGGATTPNGSVSSSPASPQMMMPVNPQRMMRLRGCSNRGCSSTG